VGIFPPDHKHLADALILGWQELARKDNATLPRLASVEPGADGFRVLFLSDVLKVDPVNRSVHEAAGEAPARIAVLVLHYLVTADGAAETGKLAGFAELPGGAAYLGPFNGRVVDRVARKFGNDPTSFLKCGMELGGRRTDLGDAGMVFRVFPRVPVTVAVWRGDEELPPGASVSFDRNVSHYLSTEDVVVACEELVNRLSKIKQALEL
jgi:hypothetical protein